MKQLDVAIGIVVHQSMLLIARRKADAVLGGYWEFPGGKCEPGEPAADCVRRELREELDIQVQPAIQLSAIEHAYGDRQVTLHPFLCTLEAGEPKALDCEEFRWIHPASLRDYRFPPANQGLIEQLIGAFTGPEELKAVSIP